MFKNSRLFHLGAIVSMVFSSAFQYMVAIKFSKYIWMDTELQSWFSLVFFGLAFSLFLTGLVIGTLEKLAKKIESEQRNHLEQAQGRLFARADEVVSAVSDIVRHYKLVLEAKKLKNVHGMVGPYVEWLENRFEELFKDAKHGKLGSPAGDFYRYANIVFSQVKDTVTCSTLADPAWFTKAEDVNYLASQVQIIKKKRVIGEHFFIVNPKCDSPSRKERLLEQIKQQVDMGFKVHVIATSDYQMEKEAALIDRDSIFLLAEVDRLTKESSGDRIISCDCYVTLENNGNPAAIKQKIDEIDSYFSELQVLTLTLQNNMPYERYHVATFGDQYEERNTKDGLAVVRATLFPEVSLS